jgi:hypothetical protein
LAWCRPARYVSANHRTHIVFADQQGRCPQGFKNVPQLRISLTYNIPRDVQVNGQYKVDAFEQESTTRARTTTTSPTSWASA